ncbi:unnamed protein product [Meganyctiphanes norvegica]|uniref:RING-type domain-containing protein n=1 Tax=Meganyctiphanes norvegica TaxID=48144 RepID=A0AAV2QMA2_MEGNR
MDVPGCNVCHEPLDEEEHQPRHLGCGHDACNTCVKALIYNGSFITSGLVCPLCKRFIIADRAEDLPINHGVIQVMRMFKGFTISETKQNKECATKDTREYCHIHKFIVEMRCITCKLWICVECKEFHILDNGCEVQEYNEALKKLKNEHKVQVQSTLPSVRNNLGLLSSKLSDIDSEKKRLEDKIAKLEDLRKNVQKSVEQGTRVIDEMDAVAARIDMATSSKELNECVHNADELHQFAQIWSKKNTDSLLERLKLDQEVYASMDINGTRSYCKLSTEDGNIYLHCFRSKEFYIEKSFKIFPCEQVQAILPEVCELVFLDLAILGEIKGRVTIRLRQDLPGYATNILLLFTGVKGHSLVSLHSQDCHTNRLGFAVRSVANKIKNFQRDENAGSIAVQGSVFACWSGQYINEFCIRVDETSVLHDKNYEMFGQVVNGMDIVKLCRNHSRQSEVRVVDCGSVIKKD